MSTEKILENSDKIKMDNKIVQYDHYIALDWSMHNMAIADLKRNSVRPVIKDVPTDLKALKSYLKNMKGSKILTIEETTSSHWLYVELLDYVDKILICDPYMNKLLSNGPKNDKLDAAKLALLLRSGMLKEVFHTDNQLYELRKLVSYYIDVVKAGVRLQNQRSALYRAENKTYKKKRDKPEEKKEELTQTEVNTFIDEHLRKGIIEYRQTQEDYVQEFYRITKNNKIISALMSVPYISIISSVQILSIVIDARRFKEMNRYLSYCGLANYEKMSGGRSYGKRQPRYNRRLKEVYKSAAVRAITSDNPIKGYYNFLIEEKGLNHKEAINSVARYIARITLGIIKTGKKYEPYDRSKVKKEKAA